MAILKIALMGNDCLKQVAEPVDDPTAPEIVRLIDDMRDTLIDIGGNGLAAPQVYINKRLVLYRVMERQIPKGADMKPVPWSPLINPVITPLTEEKKPIWERCLSLPGLHGMVPRYTRIRLNHQTLAGEQRSIEARGYHAMLLQHECDHLDGFLYPMRMEDMSTLSFNSELGQTSFLVDRDLSEFAE
ncbi:MAG: peptide deformylase [Rhodospirillaceae bacterium]